MSEVRAWSAKKSVLVVALAVLVLASSVLAVVGAVPSPVASTASPQNPVTPTAPVAPSGSAGGAATPTPTSSYAHTEATARANLVDQARQAFVDNGVSLNDFLPPTLNVAQAPTTETGNHIVPLYNYAAAPIGVSTFGLENTTGATTPYILNTTSLLGTFSTSDPEGLQVLSPYYGTLQAYGDQLNTVLNNTTIFGNGGYDFWLQNVIQYTTTSNTLSFVLNIWNFSSPSGLFPSNSILHGNGRVEESEVYETSGPSITIAYPYTLDLYLNTTVGSYDGSPMVNEVYFNYTVLNGAGKVVCPTTEPSGDVCGEYDNVYFNSGVNVAPGSAQISANGYQYTPLGLPSDMEMDVGIGQSDGANANVVYSNATVGLYTLNATTGTYQAPPSAYDFGSETGETGVGALTTWNDVNGQPVAYLRTGPSLLTGLWNVTGGTTGVPSIGPGSEGAYPLNYAGVTPGNAFLAIGQGADNTNASLFQIAPSFGWYSGKGALGPNIWLPAGDYTVQVMLSGYNEATVNVDLATSGASLTVALARSASPTVYTPLWAYSNSDLANLSTFGAGTAGNPYILVGSQPGSIAPEFAVLNDYLFIVYSGVWINGTTAYFEFNPPPSLEITEPSWWYFQTETLAYAYGGTLDYNQLPMYFYHTSNMVVEHGAGIGLWSSDIEVGHDYAVYCNVCTNDVFAANTFNVSSEGLEFLGSGVAPNSGIGHNYVWGNTFAPFSLPGEDTGSPAETYGGMSLPSTGLTVDQSGNWIYNNAFYTNQTASSAASTRGGGAGLTYTNFWNATGGYQPATNAISVNGVVMAGSILGTSYQGGNFWFNYGTTADPYGVPYNARTTSSTGTAGIAGLGDLAPLTPYMTSAVAATPSVVPTGIGNGLYPITFTESGLASGTSWTVHVDGVPVYEPRTFSTETTNPSNTSKVSVSLVTNILWVPNGTYAFSVGVPTGYAPSPLGGSVTVNGAGVAQSVSFSSASVSLSPTSGPVGTVDSLTAGGFAASTTYQLYLDSTEGKASNFVTSFTTSSGGSFSGTATIPSLSAGAYYVDVFEGSTYIISSSTKTTVTTPFVSVGSAQGPVGAAVSWSGTGFAPSTSYALTLDTSRGTMGALATTCMSTAGGALSCGFTVPSVSGGAYYLDVFQTPSDSYIPGGTTSFTVTVPSVTVTPGQGPVGAPVTVAGSGFSASSTLAALDFDGVSISTCTAGSLTTSAAGAFSCSLAVPSGTTGSTVQVTDVGGQSAFATFEVTTPAILVTPAQGPVGATYSVSGSGFTVSAGATVAFNGVSQTPTGCSDGSFLGTAITTDAGGNFACSFVVPGGTPGSASVDATDGTTGAVAAGSFTVTALSIMVSPGQGPVGATVTVTGTGFSVSSTLASLTIGGVAVTGCSSGSLATDGSGSFSCTFVVPSGTSGSTVVATDAGGQSTSGSFVVTALSVTVAPKSGPIGRPVTVSGSGFSVSTTVSLVFDGVAISTCTSGSLGTDGVGTFSCSFSVPSGTTGTAVVVTDVGGSFASAKFTVTTPKITLSPKKGPVGATVTITGTGFTPSSTPALDFKGVPVSSCSIGGGLTTGSAGKFSCTLAVPSGTSSTSVTVTDVWGQVASATFKVTTPHITLTPKKGAPGSSVTVTGTGFSVSTALKSFVFDNVVITSCTSGSLTTNSTGAFSCTFVVPTGTSGTAVTATDVGGQYATATFKVT